MAILEVKDACARLQRLTLLEVHAERELIIDIWETIRNSLKSYYDSTPAAIAQPLIIRSEPVPQSPGPVDARPTSTSTFMPSLPMIINIDGEGALSTQIRNHATRQRQPQSSNSLATVSTVKATKLKPHTRAYRNAFANTEKHRDISTSREFAVVDGLSKRAAEFPPARAGGDISGSRKGTHYQYLEGLFGAMYISKEYNSFKSASKRPGKGRPKHCYSEYAERRGIINEESLPAIIKLGTKLNDLWTRFAGYRGILFLLDKPATVRSLSPNGTTRLWNLVKDDKKVMNLAGSLSQGIDKAWKGYQKVAEQLWSKEKITVTMQKITDCMNSGGLEEINVEHGLAVSQPGKSASHGNISQTRPRPTEVTGENNEERRSGTYCTSTDAPKTTDNHAHESTVFLPAGEQMVPISSQSSLRSRLDAATKEADPPQAPEEAVVRDGLEQGNTSEGNPRNIDGIQNKGNLRTDQICSVDAEEGVENGYNETTVAAGIPLFSNHRYYRTEDSSIATEKMTGATGDGEEEPGVAQHACNRPLEKEIQSISESTSALCGNVNGGNEVGMLSLNTTGDTVLLPTSSSRHTELSQAEFDTVDAAMIDFDSFHPVDLNFDTVDAALINLTTANEAQFGFDRVDAAMIDFGINRTQTEWDKVDAAMIDFDDLDLTQFDLDHIDAARLEFGVETTFVTPTL